MSTKDPKLGLWVLTALVVGNMVGSGIFMLPRKLGEVASPGGVLLAWVLTGVGVLLIALVFGNLALRKPKLTGGPQEYARALFREGTHRSALSGYLVAWGYWVANWAGNVAIITTFASYLSTFFPVMTSEQTLWTVFGETITVGSLLTFLVCTALLWGMNAIVLRGVKGAGQVNFVATAAKVIGFAFFIVAALFVFQASNLVPFVDGKVSEDGQSVGLLGQVNDAAVTTLWAFVGVEAAIVFSSRARRPSDVKMATILGLVTALVIYIGISVLVMGALPADQLVQSEKPLVDALSTVVGSSGPYIMAGLGLVSLLGSTIGWIMMSSEVPYQAALQGIFPKVFLKENKHGAPVYSLIITNLMSQIFIFSTISQSVAEAFDFIIVVATLAYLVPYVVASIYQLKLVFTGESYLGQGNSRVIDGVIAALATIYSLWVIRAGTADMNTFMLGVFMLAVGIIFYPLVRKSPYYPVQKKSSGVKKTSL